MTEEIEPKIYFPDHVKEHIYKQIESCHEEWKKVKEEQKEMLKNGPLSEEDIKYLQHKKNKIYRKKNYYERLTKKF